MTEEKSSVGSNSPIHIGDVVKNTVDGSTFTVAGRGPVTAKVLADYPSVHAALQSKLTVVHVSPHTIVWGGDAALKAAGADGDTIMWGT
jgi:hypothetical protein